MPYANARFCAYGDSLIAGKKASPLSSGWAYLLRAAFPGDVLISGAPSATIGQTIEGVPSIALMRPRYVLICLGTNNWVSGVTMAQSQADMTTLLGRFDAIGVIPVLLSSPPCGNQAAAIFNTWLQTLGRPYIDIYTVLLGTGGNGALLNAAYDSSDGIHFNDPGHALVVATVIVGHQAARLGPAG